MGTNMLDKQFLNDNELDNSVKISSNNVNFDIFLELFNTYITEFV